MRTSRAGAALGVASIIALVLAACGGGGQGGGDAGNGGGDLGPLDPRCEDLCADSDAACAAGVEACQGECQVRVARLAPLCAACLLDGVLGGSCDGSGPCCPDPSFPNVLGCASACAGSTGVNPAGDHPICAELCDTNDPACGAERTQCLQTCAARIEGVTGLCALCLLDDASSDDCQVGAPCCPNPSYQNSVSDCASLCGL